MIVIDKAKRYSTTKGNPYPKAYWSHLFSSLSGEQGTTELLHFAQRLGLNIHWIQKRGTMYEHFDITSKFYDRAISLGARPVSMKQLFEIIRSKRETNSSKQLPPGLKPLLDDSE